MGVLPAGDPGDKDAKGWPAKDGSSKYGSPAGGAHTRIMAWCLSPGTRRMPASFACRQVAWCGGGPCAGRRRRVHRPRLGSTCWEERHRRPHGRAGGCAGLTSGYRPTAPRRGTSWPKLGPEPPTSGSRSRAVADGQDRHRPGLCGHHRRSPCRSGGGLRSPALRPPRRGDAVAAALCRQFYPPPMTPSPLPDHRWRVLPEVFVAIGPFRRAETLAQECSGVGAILLARGRSVPVPGPGRRPAGSPAAPRR